MKRGRKGNRSSARGGGSTSGAAVSIASAASSGAGVSIGSAASSGAGVSIGSAASGQGRLQSSIPSGSGQGSIAASIASSSGQGSIAGGSAVGGDSPPRRGELRVRYSDIPQSSRFKLKVNENCAAKFSSLLSKLRDLATQNSKCFSGIRNLNFRHDEFGFAEVKLVTPDKFSVRLVIRLWDLYFVGFKANSVWYQFDNCAVRLLGFKRLHFGPEYLNVEAIRVGPKTLISSIEFFAKFDCGDSSYERLQLEAQSFMFYICESVRFFPVEALVRSTLGGESGMGNQFGYVMFKEDELYASESAHLLGSGSNRDAIEYCRKVDAFVAEGVIPDYICKLIMRHRQISVYWYVYSFIGEMDVKSEDKKDLLLKSVRSVRCSIAVLSCTNLEKKALPSWKHSPPLFRKLKEEIAKVVASGDVVTQNMYMDKNKRDQENSGEEENFGEQQNEEKQETKKALKEGKGKKKRKSNQV